MAGDGRSSLDFLPPPLVYFLAFSAIRLFVLVPTGGAFLGLF